MFQLPANRHASLCTPGKLHNRRAWYPKTDCAGVHRKHAETIGSAGLLGVHSERTKVEALIGLGPVFVSQAVETPRQVQQSASVGMRPQNTIANVQ